MLSMARRSTLEHRHVRNSAAVVHADDDGSPDDMRDDPDDGNSTVDTDLPEESKNCYIAPTRLLVHERISWGR